MQDLIVVGLGQLGTLLGAAALQEGIRVTPLVRRTDRHSAFATAGFDAPLLVAVGEGDAKAVIDEIPRSRRDHVVLIQNELFPKTWAGFGLKAPTIAIAWFSKKIGRPVEVARQSAVSGPHAPLIARLMESSGAPCVEVDTAERDLHLVAKFAFIFAINGLGLVHNRTLSQWLAADLDKCKAAISDGIRLGCAHIAHDVDTEKATAMAIEAMEGLGDYPARGRTALARMKRAAADANAMQIELPTLDAIDLDSLTP